MNIVTLLPFIVIIGAMFLMTRSAKKKQRQAAEMRDQMQPGTGIRTIGGMYATVKEVGDDTVLLEIASGVHARFGKNAVGAVLEPEEYERIVHGVPAGDLKADDAPVVPDDASELTAVDESGEDGKIELGKSGPAGATQADDDGGTGPADEDAAEAEAGEAKRDGDADAK